MLRAPARESIGNRNALVVWRLPMREFAGAPGWAHIQIMAIGTKSSMLAEGLSFN